MPVFISYNQKDTGFVDALARNLVEARHSIWLDRWELNAGDSLTAKIEESLTSSSAILVILSKNSTQSNWCKRELTAGLVRELEESKTIVMPIVIDDCNIPLFLRDKLYVDFRKGYDQAFALIDRSLARVSNPTTARQESPSFFTDFAYDWKSRNVEYSEETWELRWSFVDHGPSVPYVIMSECKIFQAEGSFLQYTRKTKDALGGIREVTRALHQSYIDKGEPTGLLSSNLTQFDAWTFQINSSEKFLAVYTYRRMGADTGMDTVVYLGNNLRMARDHVEQTISPSAETLRRAARDSG